MIGAIIGAAASIGNMVAGGIKTSKENKERKRLLQEERSRIQSQYDKDYYADYMSRSDTQSLVKKIQDQSRKRSESAAATAAVMGSTPESVVAQQQAEAEGMGQAMSQIAGYGDQWKQGVADRYNQQMSNLNGMQSELSSERSANLSNMLSNGAKGLAGAVTGLDGLTFNKQPVSSPLSAPINPGVTVPKVKIPTKFGE